MNVFVAFSMVCLFIACVNALIAYDTVVKKDSTVSQIFWVMSTVLMTTVSATILVIGVK